MNRVVQIAHLAVLLAGTALCFSAGWFFFTLTRTVPTEIQQVDRTLQNVNIAVADLDSTIRAVNRPCGAGKPCGTLADLAKTLGTARLTLGQIEIAANHEDSRIGVLDAQEAQIASDTHTALANVADGVLSAKQAISRLTPIETETTAELQELHKATASLDALVSDPNLKEMAANLNAASENANTTLQHVSGTTADVQQAVHSYLHPTWAQKAWHAVSNTGLEVAKFFW